MREDGGTTELSNQRRRLAVLAIVAAAPGGVARERLLFLLWPDADADKGRHALNQIVYNLRRELGASPIDGVAELSLLPDVMSADLIEFRAAIAAADHIRAAELYTGPFLDGFFVPGAAEFDHWAEEERSRTTRQAVTAIEKLSAAAELADDQTALVTWTRRLVEIDPLSARRALAHMRALVRQGDVDAAIAYGRRYDVLARADGDDVDLAVAAEVERLRALPTNVSQPSAKIVQANPLTVESIEPVGVLTAPSVGQPVAPLVAPHDALPVAIPIAPSAAASPPAVDTADTLVTSPRRTRSWIPIGIAAAVALIGAIAWPRTQKATLPIDIDDRILVADVQLPIADSADGRALAIALQSALQQSSRVRLVSPASISDAIQRMGRPPLAGALPDSVALEVAEREGARYVVSLAVVPSGPSARLVTLRVLDPTSRTVLTSYSAPSAATELVSTIDIVASRLRRDLGDSMRELADAMPLPRASTPSLEALRLLAGGRAAFNRGLYNDARALYAGAITLDSGFAAAYVGLASIAYVQNNIPEGDAQMQRALALSDRLPPRERLLIEAQSARGRGDWMRAATLHRAYLIRYPDDYDMYSMLGYDLMRGKNPDESLVAYDSLLAHRRPSTTTLINIAANHAQLERPALARRAQVDAVTLDSSILFRALTNEEFGKTLLELGFADSARTIYRLLLTRTTSDQARAHRSLAYADLYEGRYSSAVRHLDTAIALGQLASQNGLSVVRDRALLASTQLALGRTDVAREQLREAARVSLANPIDPAALYWTGKPLARLGDTATVRRLLDSARARTRTTDIGQVSATLALEAELLIAQGRFADGAVTASRAIAGDPAANLIETLAYALERGGKLREARAQYESLLSTRAGVHGKEGQQMARLAPLAIARIDALLGRPDDAQRAVGALLERLPHADADLPMFSAERLRPGALQSPARPTP